MSDKMFFSIIIISTVVVLACFIMCLMAPNTVQILEDKCTAKGGTLIVTVKGNEHICISNTVILK